MAVSGPFATRLRLTLPTMNRFSTQMSRRSLSGTPIIMVNKQTSNLVILGLIEALEVFTGLIIHADSKAEDKVRCKLVRSL